MLRFCWQKIPAPFKKLEHVLKCRVYSLSHRMSNLKIFNILSITSTGLHHFSAKEFGNLDY